MRDRETVARLINQLKSLTAKFAKSDAKVAKSHSLRNDRAKGAVNTGLDVTTLGVQAVENAVEKRKNPELSLPAGAAPFCFLPLSYSFTASAIWWNSSLSLCRME